MSAVLALTAAVAVWRLLVRRPWPGRLLPVAGRRPPHRALTARARRPDTERRTGDPPATASSTDGAGDLAEVADLLAVAFGAGLGPGPALDAVAGTSPGPTGQALGRVAAARARGMPLAEALDLLADGAGPEGRELAAVLRAALDTGTAAAPALRALAATARRRERRRVEARIRRLPVLLAVPLVLFVLPAFVVMTLVPVALTVVGELRVVAAPVPTRPFPLAGDPAPAPDTEGR